MTEHGELQKSLTQIFAQVDQEVGQGNRRDQRAERLTMKLELIMSDPDINSALGAYMHQLILPGEVGQRMLTSEQAGRVIEASRRILFSQS